MESQGNGRIIKVREKVSELKRELISLTQEPYMPDITLDGRTYSYSYEVGRGSTSVAHCYSDW